MNGYLLWRQIAEEVIFGKDNISTGAGGGQGFRYRSWPQKWQKHMVTKYGMSAELGPVAYGENEEEVFLGRSVATQQNMSEETARKVDSEVRKLVDEGYEEQQKY